MAGEFKVTNTTQRKLPKLFFSKIKNEILGQNYDLSLVFIGEKKSQALNRAYRGKNEPTDVLSFPLNKKTGEIFICLEQARKKSASFEKSFEKFVGFLFIHGALHLKGMVHGSRMEKAEIKFCQKFKIY